MPHSCVYLGWKRPAVQSSVAFLLHRYNTDGLVDLTTVTVAAPTRRAGRRLREALLEEAQRRELAIFPPRVTTVGALPELLYEKKLPFASPLVQQFAWADALRRTDRETLSRVLPRCPDSASDPRWLELGALLRRQHLELTDHQLDFAEVAARGRSLDTFTDYARWQALAKVQARYLRTLDRLELWDRQTARNYAVEHGECMVEGELVLVGAVDLSRTLRSMLDQLGDQVTSLVFAEKSLAHRFDPYGCVLPEAWLGAPIGVEDHQILVADGPANQADAVVYAIESFEGKYAAEDITIGVPDRSLVPHLENKLKQFKIDARWGPGRSLTASPPAQWLRMVADYLASQRYDHFAELLRHSDTLQYLAATAYPRDAVKELDRFFEQHLPDYIRDDPHAAGDLPLSVARVLDLLRRLQDDDRSPRAWGAAIQEVLTRLYEHRQFNVDQEHDRASLEACDRLSAAIERLELIPDQLSPDVSASAAILMLLSQIDDEEVPPIASENVIEMVGWLDLPLDDAAVAIVTNMNDGVVPKSVSSDLFLPNTIREELGLDDNARRYARDAFALQSLLNSRMAVRLIVGRRAATNDPLRPSRLLLAMPNEKLPARCLRLFNGTADCAPIVMSVDQDELQFQVPRPRPLAEPVASLSVSDFGNYLACPYRFYLRKVQRLRAMDDQLTELDAPTFGTLAHDVLEEFGKSEYRDSSNPDEIRLYLFDRLASRSRHQFGRYPKPTVQVQLAQLKRRLSAFAERQAEWRGYGWKILRTELFEDDGQLMVDGHPIQLRGRIDRIDHREVDGRDEYAVLDYKTGDVGDPPKRKHLVGHQPGEPVLPEHWVDLQLPLYRHLLTSLEIDEEIETKTIKLGYILLPADADAAQFALAQWNADTLHSADLAAAEIVRRIRRQEFWPPTDPYPFRNFDDYASIVQHGVFGRETFTLEATA